MAQIWRTFYSPNSAHPYHKGRHTHGHLRPPPRQERARELSRRSATQRHTTPVSQLSDPRGSPEMGKIREGAVLEGRHFPSTAAKRHTVSDLIDMYITDVLPNKRPSTAYNQRYQLRWWKAQLGHYALADVTPALLIEYRDKLARNKASRQLGATVKRWLAVLSHCFTMAVREWQWCDENPVLKITKPRERRGRVRYLNDEERQRLLESCKVSRNPYLSTIVVLALSTGARKGVRRTPSSRQKRARIKIDCYAYELKY